MFKKENPGPVAPRAATGGGAPPARPAASTRSAGTATIGPSITVKGEVSGDEDLVIQGRVEGGIHLAKHNVTIGSSGRVEADVRGRTVIVEGEVVGDLEAAEQIILRHSAVVEGNIKAPRVALEDGAVFRGGIEMDAASKAGKGTGPQTAAATVNRAAGVDAEAEQRQAAPTSKSLKA